MLSSHTINLGGDEFTLQQYPTTQALKYGIAIGKIAGAMLAGGLEGDITPENADDILGGMDAGKMVEGLFSQIDQGGTPILIRDMIRDALAGYQVSGVTKTSWDESWYEARFAGCMDQLIELLIAIFEDNFGEAIELIKKKIPKAQGMKEQSSDSAPGSGLGESTT